MGPLMRDFNYSVGKDYANKFESYDIDELDLKCFIILC